ncbi:hypothetical protein AB6A40_000971 [Gnathostoma spinigerum]|uniref:ADP-ribosylation factor-related protein 1 n=1 Tax=Gnathostoma spinigerum TaxID=75299 RepID=A0ABD6E594_9BILA
MYTLGYGIYKNLTQKSEYYIVIVGLDNAGKTTFLEQTKMRFGNEYHMLDPLKITSTVGLNIGKIDVGSVRLNFWDLGGQKDLHSLWHKYFEDSHALIFIVDSSDMHRFPEVSHAFRTFCGVLSSERVQKMPILVVCNKSDLDDCASVEQIRELTTDDRHLGDLAVVPVSALQGLNVDRCIRWLVITLSRSRTIDNFDL